MQRVPISTDVTTTGLLPISYSKTDVDNET